jgi:DoxX-like family
MMGSTHSHEGTPTMPTAPRTLAGPSPLLGDVAESTSSTRLYRIAIVLFSALFLGSAVFGVLDIDASKAEWARLGFPWWTFWGLTAAKVVGVAVIVAKSPRSLKDFAFAGFLFDLLLAAGAHLEIPESKVILPIGGLAVWTFAYVMDRRHDATATATSAQPSGR